MAAATCCRAWVSTAGVISGDAGGVAVGAGVAGAVGCGAAARLADCKTGASVAAVIWIPGVGISVRDGAAGFAAGSAVLATGMKAGADRGGVPGSIAERAEEVGALVSAGVSVVCGMRACDAGAGAGTGLAATATVRAGCGAAATGCAGAGVACEAGLCGVVGAVAILSTGAVVGAGTGWARAG